MLFIYLLCQPQHTHTRQSSSPETLVHGLENLKCQKSNGILRSESLYRSPSAVSPLGGYRSLSSDSESKSSHPVISSRVSFYFDVSYYCDLFVTFCSKLTKCYINHGYIYVGMIIEVISNQSFSLFS